MRIILGILLCSSSKLLAAVIIHGAGASFPFPLYMTWTEEYRKKNPDTLINYQSVGSSSGVRQFLEGKTIDFAGTDVPLTDEQRAQNPDAFQVPTTLGAVAIIYHLPEVKKTLQFSGEVVGDIYLGKITQWNDARIAALNPGVALPAKPILVVHRSDGSGTTHVFTEYLSKVSPEWKAKAGAGASVKWPTGLGGKGNEGVAATVLQTQGAFGYVELVYAKENTKQKDSKIAIAVLKNSAGVFVAPELENIKSAADAVTGKTPKTLAISLTNAPGKKSYPISAFTYIIGWKTAKNGDKGLKLKEFLTWALKEGQTLGHQLSYASLPPTVVSAALKELGQN